MPLPLSTVAIQEKNKLANSTSVFLLLLQITVPGLEDPIRVVANTENIIWNGHEWIAFPFEINEIVESNTGEVPRVDVRVSNVGRAMEMYVHEYDRHCKINGRVPIEARIIVVNSLGLESPEPEVEHVFELLQPKSSPQWMTFVLGAANPWNRRFPQRRMIPSCGWRFKSPRCGYAGAAATCDGTITSCRQLGNTRFGGAYAT